MKKALKPGIIVLCVIALVAVIAFICNCIANNRVFLTKYSFTHDEIPSGFDNYKILCISDIHEAPFEKQIIAHIKKQKPDIIAIIGDMIQLPDYALFSTLEIIKNSGDIPVYVISGNHEMGSGHYQEIMESLTNAGAINLDDFSVVLQKNGDAITLAGLKEPEHSMVTVNQYEEINRTVATLLKDKPEFAILLNHRAVSYHHIKNCGADLILSGDTHGGIIRLPFMGGLVGKEFENDILPRYTYGVYKDNDGCTMIINGGCDKNPKKTRVFNPPEVVLITLNKGAGKQ